MRTADMLDKMAEGAAAKADFWAASDKPWALRNLRLYQGLMSKWGREADALRRSR